VNPHGPAAGSLRSVRGGSWRQPRLYLRTTARDGAPAETRSPEIGFRCAR
jgi:formylglycine-generating enzyme required for sulfatase activity